MTNESKPGWSDWVEKASQAAGKAIQSAKTEYDNSQIKGKMDAATDQILDATIRKIVREELEKNETIADLKKQVEELRTKQIP